MFRPGRARNIVASSPLVPSEQFRWTRKLQKDRGPQRAPVVQCLYNNTELGFGLVVKPLVGFLSKRNATRYTYQHEYKCKDSQHEPHRE